MTKIFESSYHGETESAEKIYVYTIDSDEEFWELENMSFEEKCEYFDVYEECDVAPGHLFHRYRFENSTEHAIVFETAAYNV